MAAQIGGQGAGITLWNAKNASDESGGAMLRGDPPRSRSGAAAYEPITYR